MSVNVVPEEEIRSILRPCQVDPQAFEEGVRARIAAAPTARPVDPWSNVSPHFRAAAAILPLSLLGCRGAPAATKVAPASIGAKWLGYLAFPAISLFVLLDATVLSVLKIRSLRMKNDAAITDQTEQHRAISLSWRDHKWAATAVFAVSLAVAMFGASWLLFLFYIVSFGILTAVLTTFFRLGDWESHVDWFILPARTDVSGSDGRNFQCRLWRDPFPRSVFGFRRLSRGCGGQRSATLANG